MPKLSYQTLQEELHASFPFKHKSVEWKLVMNTVISVDVHEVISIKTNFSPTTEELVALVSKQPFLIDFTLGCILPHIRRFAEDNFGSSIEIETFCTIEGHASVQVKLKHFARKEDSTVALSILQAEGLFPLMQATVWTLATLLPLPYTICSCCRTRHKCIKCPKALSALQADVAGEQAIISGKPFLTLF